MFICTFTSVSHNALVPLFLDRVIPQSLSLFQGSIRVTRRTDLTNHKGGNCCDVYTQPSLNID